MLRLRPPLVAATVVVALLLGACGGDDDPADADGPSTTEAAGSSAPAPPDAGGGADPDDPPADDGSGPAVPSSGCEGEHHAPVTKEAHDIEVDGTARSYLLTAPEDEEPTPLVVDIHGLLEGADVHSQQSGLGEYGIEQGFATVFPNGIDNAWQVDPGSADLAYIDAVVDEVVAGRCIDTSRIYATGLSMGAMMTSLLACERADRYAAFAPVNGLRMPEGCAPARPVPMLAFHGTADPILLFNGGVDTSSFTGGEQGASASIPEPDLDGEGYPATAEEWAALQDCTDPVDADEPPVVERTWTCPAGASMELDIIVGQGHGWPGSPFADAIQSIVGPQVDGVVANERLWEFFQQHRNPVEGG